MFKRLLTLPLLLALLAGCSNDFSPLQAGTAVNDDGVGPEQPPTRVLVVGDGGSPKLADYLEERNMDVLDVPYSRYAISDDLRMSGDYIVWSDNRNGDLDIYGYQISTGKEFVVAKAPGKQWLPDVAGDYIVWEDYRNDNADIYGYYIPKKKVFAIATESQNQLFPRTDGVNVVWQDQRDGNDDIYRFLLNEDGGTAIPVKTGAGDQKYPLVSGDHIVWENYENGYNDIFLYTIGSTDPPLNLTSDKPDSSQYQPHIDGDYVIWLDNSTPANGEDIRAYRISTAQPIDVAVGAGQQVNPQLSGNRVVWQDNRNLTVGAPHVSQFDIYTYQLPNGPATRLTNDDSDQTLPQISGDLVTWQDRRNGNYDIYAYGLSGGGEKQITSDTTAQTHPRVANGRIAWLDERRGVVDLYWSKDLGDTLSLATNTWLTPAGMIGDISKYDVLVLGNDFVSEAVMLNLYDAAIAAGIGVVGLGGTGGSLARSLANAGRYGISVTPGSGCSAMEISATVDRTSSHPLFRSINIGNLVELEISGAVTRDELAIDTDFSVATPATWTVQALFSSSMCNAGGNALVEFTDGKSKVILDGSAPMADEYLYWSGDRWDLFANEVGYVKPVK